jgi:hypothetical protein
VGFVDEAEYIRKKSQYLGEKLTNKLIANCTLPLRYVGAQVSGYA